MADQNLHPIFANILAPHMPRREPTDAQLERLNDAHQRVLQADRAVDYDNVDTVRAYIRATNVLVDACVDCGMPTDFADHEGWAAERVARWLVEA